MFYIKNIKIFIVMMSLFNFLQASDFPSGVIGFTYYDPYKEHLAPRSKGIYKIFEYNHNLRYIGSSCDIEKRLADHHRKGVLKQGNRVQAIIFDKSIRQENILAYERILIGKFNPPLNRHTGTPGRAWRADQMSKLQTFFEHNEPYFLPKGRKTVIDILNGQVPYSNRRMMNNLFMVMRLFR